MRYSRGSLDAMMRKTRLGASAQKLTRPSPQRGLPQTRKSHSAASVAASSNSAIFVEQNPEARAAYEKLHQALAAGFARQLKVAEPASHAAANLGSVATDQHSAEPQEMARIVVDGYVTELIRFRDPVVPRRLPPGLLGDLRDLSKSLEVVAKRAWRVWSKLPPGPSQGLAALEQWSEDTLKLAKALNAKNWLPQNAGKWNVIDEVIWGLLKLLKQVTGRYHYPEVAEIAAFCLDDPNNRSSVDGLKMIVQRRKLREEKFLQALTKTEQRREGPQSTLVLPSAPRKIRPRNR
jgi:hypothetical protein